MGVKNGNNDSVLANWDVGSEITVKLMIKGMIISIVTGIDNAWASSCEEHIEPTAA